MSRTKTDLGRLQDEEALLEQSLLSGRVQLDSITKSLKTTQEEINQVSAGRGPTGHGKMFCQLWPISSGYQIIILTALWEEREREVSVCGI